MQKNKVARDTAFILPRLNLVNCVTLNDLRVVINWTEMDKTEKAQITSSKTFLQKERLQKKFDDEWKTFTSLWSGDTL